MCVYSMWYLADQLKSFSVLSLVGNTNGLKSADGSQVHIKNEVRLLHVEDTDRP